jgi:ABC-type branched-subunit amino acid transport system substrate-binding protein
MNQSNYVFQFSMQAKQQMAELVSEAISRGHKRFGMFYPNISYGQTLAELFAEEVKSRGGQVIANVEYPRDTFDLFSQTRRLKDELARTAGIDALFIPDSFKMINALVPALEYSQIKGISLLGTNAWNDAALTLTIADLFPGSFFVDFYDANSTAQAALDFKQRFTAAFGHNPRVLEAYGYDIASYIQEVASQSGSHNIKESVLNGGGYNGVTGVKGFREGEGAIIDPVVMKIRSTGIGE